MEKEKVNSNNKAYDYTERRVDSELYPLRFLGREARSKLIALSYINVKI